MNIIKAALSNIVLGFFPGFLICLQIYSCQPSEGPTAADLKRPNVLLILTDDQGYGDLSVHGNDSIDTPILDDLATTGVRLDNFYVSPVCAPTRASLLTGRYHLRTGTSWVTRGAEIMRDSEFTLAELFKDKGYRTGCFGKWHNGAHYPYNPMGQGFEQFVGFSAGHWSNYFDTRLESNQGEIKTSGYITDVLTDKALDFIQANADSNFFCYVSYNAPHSPFQVPDQYFEKYKSLGLKDETACVYGMVENIDFNIGRLFEKLQQLDLTNNTIIIFITDNGPQFFRYNAGMKGRKGWVTDGGVRVPCLIKWGDRLKSGEVIKELTAHIDLVPTLVDLCQLEVNYPSPIDGISIASLLTGNADSLQPRNIFTHFGYEKGEVKKYPGAVRNRHFRLVFDNSGKPQLTDIRTDPSESFNIADSLPDVVSDLSTVYTNWFHEVTTEGFTIPAIPVGYPQAPEVILPAHEASLKGNVGYKFNVNGWAHDWITNWKQSEDTIQWEIEVVEPGSYHFGVAYSCDPGNTGSKLMLSANRQQLSATITKSFVPEKVPSPDRSLREQEALEQNWGYLELGSLDLQKGSYPLYLTASDIHKEVGDIKEIRITRDEQ